MSERSFFLGGPVDPSTGKRGEGRFELDPDDLTTHGIIVGMTGSGKTGLGVALIEEARLAGIPCLVIDPKGDMADLALTFPTLDAESFRPWVEGTADGGDDPAASTAAAWRDGLASWGLGPADIEQLTESSELTVYTPGSTAGVPVDIIGSLRVPSIGWQGNEEVLRDEIQGFVTSLLALAEIDADPIADPEHVLLSNLIEHAWSAGSDLGLEGLIGQVVDPPMRKLGVFDVDEFFPPARRKALAMRLNGLVASPSFQAWTVGTPLDIDELLGSSGHPRTSVMYLAHLTDEERQFVVTLLLNRLVTWMRAQAGTPSLRALVYMDEMYGFAPPSAAPPAKKPLLTLLKQARAFGIGLVLATQNPVDLDYKAMSNAGTWMIGRLQTQRDKDRILEGMSNASGEVDVGTIDRLISGLGKRTFVFHSTRASTPSVFTTRWVMSYLAGPLTRPQIEELTPDGDRTAPPTPAPSSTPPEPAAAPESAAGRPPTAEGVETVWIDPAAPWVATVGGSPGSDVLAPAAVATVDLRYDDRYAGVDHHETWEAVIHPLDQDATSMIAVDHDPRDFRADEPPGVGYPASDPGVGSPAFWRSLAASIKDRLAAEQSISVLKNATLGIYSRVGETAEEFATRCTQAAHDRADSEIADLRRRYEPRLRAASRTIREADDRVRTLEADVDASRQEELIGGAGDLLGALFGGRRSSSGLRRVASRRNRTTRTETRHDEAMDKLAREQAELEDLESELADQVEEIGRRWDGATGDVETVDIPLERSDIDVRSLRLLWLPVASA